MVSFLCFLWFVFFFSPILSINQLFVNETLRAEIIQQQEQAEVV